MGTKVPVLPTTERQVRELTRCESDDQDPLSYVISANLHRRQLSATQRAMVGAKLATLKNGSNQHAKKEGSPKGLPSSIETASEILNVGSSSIKRAKQVLDSKNKPLVEAVESGKVSVSLAAKLVNETDDKKRTPQSPPNELRHSTWCFATMAG